MAHAYSHFLLVYTIVTSYFKIVLNIKEFCLPVKKKHFPIKWNIKTNIDLRFPSFINYV